LHGLALPERDLRRIELIPHRVNGDSSNRTIGTHAPDTAKRCEREYSDAADAQVDPPRSAMTRNYLCGAH